MTQLPMSRAAIERASKNGTLPGDACPEPLCRGRIGVYCVEQKPLFTVRWLCCRKCGFKPEDTKWVSSNYFEVGTTP